MGSPDLFILKILKALVDVALWSLVGQGLVGLLAGARRGTNPIYQLFQIITKPAVKVVRFITPKVILDRNIPIVTFFLLLWLSIFLAWAKRFLAA